MENLWGDIDKLGDLMWEVKEIIQKFLFTLHYRNNGNEVRMRKGH
jgi:hypothetical protein